MSSERRGFRKINPENALRRLPTSSYVFPEPPEVKVKRAKLMTEAKIKACLDFGQKEKLLKWLLSLEFGHEQVLSWDEECLIDQYLFSGGEAPKLSLDEVKEKVLPALMKIARRQAYGKTAIETLRLPSRYYESLVKAGICRFSDFGRLNSQIIKQICPCQEDLRILQDLLLDRDCLWNPKVVYKKHEIT